MKVEIDEVIPLGADATQASDQVTPARNSVVNIEPRMWMILRYIES